jgi:hypothetical protein
LSFLSAASAGTAIASTRPEVIKVRIRFIFACLSNLLDAAAWPAMHLFHIRTFSEAAAGTPA